MQDWSHIQPGRIQTLSSEQEIVLKQVWAHFLIYFGYELSFPISDLPYNECYVASSSVQQGGNIGGDANGLARSSTRGSLNSNVSRKTSGTTASKKKGFFGKKKTETAEAAPADLKRMQQIQQQSSYEKYHKVMRMITIRIWRTATKSLTIFRWRHLLPPPLRSLILELLSSQLL